VDGGREGGMKVGMVRWVDRLCFVMALLKDGRLGDVTIDSGRPFQMWIMR